MKYLFFLMMSCAVFAVEPFLTLPLNDGNLENIAIGGTAAEGLKVTTTKPAMLSWKEGRNGQALFFAVPEDQKGRDVHGCLSIVKNNAIDFTKPFTATVWVCPDEKILRTTMHDVISDVRSDRGPGFRLSIGWDCFYLLTGDGKTSISITSVPSKNPIIKGAWSHLAMTWDGKKAAIFLNGTKVAESEADKEFVLTKGSDALYIGAYRGGYAYGFPGAISDVKFYPGAMTDTEIMTLAKEIVR